MAGRRDDHHIGDQRTVDQLVGDEPRPSALLPAGLGALGVVFGDIGTSPLYAIRQCFFGAYQYPLRRRISSAFCHWSSGR
ncbi:MAG: KUP/HAK/KT family potassium transporter [Gammaproteobacteria bacterium]